jgi:uncharacterized repeat protein (TIGR01451 family)
MKSIFNQKRAIARHTQPKVTKYTFTQKTIFFSRVPLGLACGCIFLFAGNAWAKVSVNKQFTPNNINPTQISKLTIELYNNKPTSATNATFTDNLPPGVEVASPLNFVNGCGGTITAVAGGTSVQLTDGVIPASSSVAGKCSITIDVTSKVTSASTQTYVNEIPIDGLTATQDGNTEKNAEAGSASLVVEPLKPVTGSKSFSTTILHGNGSPTTMTITLNNPNFLALTEAELTDNLPPGMKVAAIPSIQNLCGGTLAAAAGSNTVKLTGGTIAPQGSCTIKVNLEASDAKAFLNQDVLNTISTTNFKTKENITLSSDLQKNITVQTGAEIAKAFNPSTIQGGETSKLTITINNYNRTAITGANLIDPMPANVTVESFDSTTCGAGTVSFTPDQVKLTGGTIPLAPTAKGAGSCQIVVTVTSTKKGSYTNTIDPGNFNGIAYNSTTAKLDVLAPVSVGKDFSPKNIIRGQETTLTITLTNTDSTPADITSFKDDLTSMGTGYTVSGAATTTCGGTVSAPIGGTLINMNSGQIPPKSGSVKGSCTITVNVKADDLTGQGGTNSDGKVYNTVPAGDLKTSLGDNPNPATAELLLNGKVQLEKSFSDSTRTQGQKTTLTIKLINTQAADVNIISFQDDLATMGKNYNNSSPAFTIASGSSATTTCSGSTVTATVGTSLIKMTGGKVSANDFCTITIPVLVGITAPSGKHTNTIKVGELKTSIGNNAIETKADITVNNAATVTKSFDPPAVALGGKSRLTIKIDRDAATPTFTGMSISDTLPTGHTIDSTPNVSNTCGGSVSAPANGSKIDLTGGNISNSGCTISVDIRVPAASAATATNTIPAKTLKTDQGASNEFAATAPIKRTAATINLNKDFSPIQINPTGTTQLKIDIKNNDTGAIDLTDVSLIDNFPLGMKLASSPTPTLTGTGCTPGTFIATPGDTKVTMNGASILAGKVCTLSVSVTSEFAGNLTNILPAKITANSKEQVVNGNQIQKTLTVLGTADVIIKKDDNTKLVSPGQTTTYVITVENAQPKTGNQWDSIAGVDVVDNQPVGVTFTGWTCTTTAGSGCSQTSGTGNVSTSITVLKGGIATITVTAKVGNLSPNTPIKNVATANLPSTVTDPDYTSNTATDINTVGGNPNVLLVKRITAVNGKTTTNAGDNLAGYINEPGNPYDDNTLEPALAPKPPAYPTEDTKNWPNPVDQFLIGGINGGNVRPGDELEYTIYFISTGEDSAKQVLFCDRVPDNVTFAPTAFNSAKPASGGLSGADRGLLLNIGGNKTSLTNVADGDIGRYFPPGEDPVAFYANQTPSRKIDCRGANTNGAVVVDLGTVPNATAPGDPSGSYGFIRFRGRVK